jgi:hypothetical protein
MGEGVEAGVDSATLLACSSVRGRRAGARAARITRFELDTSTPALDGEEPGDLGVGVLHDPAHLLVHQPLGALGHLGRHPAGAASRCRWDDRDQPDRLAPVREPTCCIVWPAPTACRASAAPTAAQGERTRPTIRRPRRGSPPGRHKPRPSRRRAGQRPRRVPRPFARHDRLRPRAARRGNRRPARPHPPLRTGQPPHSCGRRARTARRRRGHDARQQAREHRATATRGSLASRTPCSRVRNTSTRVGSRARDARVGRSASVGLAIRWLSHLPGTGVRSCLGAHSVFGWNRGVVECVVSVHE